MNDLPRQNSSVWSIRRQHSRNKLRASRSEDFWFRVAARSENETEIRLDNAPAEHVWKGYPAVEKIRSVLEETRGEESIFELCRRENIAASMCYGWSKEAGQGRMA